MKTNKIKHPKTSEGWACKLSSLLHTVFGTDRFPVDVATLALEYTKTISPRSPIVIVKGDILPGFEGALFNGKKGWGILYNEEAFLGRRNFTLGHELGHYLVHRTKYPEGKYCTSEDMSRWDSEEGQIEQEANTFSANLLMPFDDFRSQIQAKTVADIEMLSHCANRYGVSLTASILQWLKYTEKRAVLIKSCDDHILWSRSSQPAYNSGVYFKSAQEIPPESAPRNTSLLKMNRASVKHSQGVWLPEEVYEMTIVVESHDYALSLLILNDTPPFSLFDEELVVCSSKYRLKA